MGVRKDLGCTFNRTWLTSSAQRLLLSSMIKPWFMCVLFVRPKGGELIPYY